MRKWKSRSNKSLERSVLAFFRMSKFDNYHLTGKYHCPWVVVYAFYPERSMEGGTVTAQKVQDVYYSSDKLLWHSNGRWYRVVIFINLRRCVAMRSFLVILAIIKFQISIRNNYRGPSICWQQTSRRWTAADGLQ